MHVFSTSHIKICNCNDCHASFFYAKPGTLHKKTFFIFINSKKEIKIKLK